jgi:hypothetical protein
VLALCSLSIVLALGTRKLYAESLEYGFLEKMELSDPGKKKTARQSGQAEPVS